MKQRKSLVQRLYEDADILSQPLPGVPVVELAGDRRILIENHQGVTEYGTQKICVQLRFGQLCISGQELELNQMTAQNLVITGIIDSISLLRGGK